MTSILSKNLTYRNLFLEGEGGCWARCNLRKEIEGRARHTANLTAAGDKVIIVGGINDKDITNTTIVLYNIGRSECVDSVQRITYGYVRRFGWIVLLFDTIRVAIGRGRQ